MYRIENRVGSRTDSCDMPCRTIAEDELDPEHGHARASRASMMRISLSLPKCIGNLYALKESVMIDTVGDCIGQKPYRVFVGRGSDKHCLSDRNCMSAIMSAGMVSENI